MAQAVLERPTFIPAAGLYQPKNTQPATFADIRLVTGDQGQGKSTVASGFVIDAYFAKLNGLTFPNGITIPASPLTAADRPWLEKRGIDPESANLFYCHIYASNGQSKIIEIPRDCIVESPVHIFCNYHLYGIRFVRIFLSGIVQYINTDLFDDGWILLDESGETNARRSMEGLNKLGVEFYSSIRKRRAHFCVMVQYNRMADLVIRHFATTRVICTYDEDTQYITCDTTRRGQPSFSIDFYSKIYHPFFDTEEKIEVPQERIDSALKKFYGTKAAA